ncbi:Pimeloyl-ACP methyl ester carboxylesterase [Gracilibacillus ureilyticus]|uniref:Pimeloyl-ACP methyl ester carboxylesterase n=1 Tax=Gracilibacillus ureilyticus TaxID=531814 RepID=A0A1H9TNK2_9BACI|nr:alpha/beta hydrolase [Gracilibacillus ureilyticus]SER98584.1 Pimeloyl-ACP methyl ester carboxylesterase [Gracilibacillus ureilyticus]
MPYTKDKPSIYFEKEGNGPALLFIPPPAMGHLTFRYQRKLQKWCTVITFDIRGDCRSEESDHPINMELLIKDVLRILDTNEIKKAIICGYSNGGVIAQAFASLYPERTLGLILIGGYYKVSSFLLRQEYKLGIWVAKKRLINILALALSKNHFRNSDAANEIYQEIRKTDPSSLVRQYITGLKYINTNNLEQINVPLLLIYGAHDFYIHKYQYLYEEKVKDVEIAFIEKSKHQVPTKYYNECNAIILNWMKNKLLL